MSPRQTLKQLLKRNKLLVAPGCFDGLSARLVQEAGFEAAYLSGGAVARSMGIPDIGLVTMSEVIDRAAQVVVRDQHSDHRRCRHRLRQCGQSSAQRARIRARRRRRNPHRRPDHAQTLRPPRRQRSYPAAEMEKKLEAALANRSDPDFCIIARTDARGVHGFDDAIKRGRAFAKLGVDAIFVEAPQSEDELAEIPRAFPTCRCWSMFSKAAKRPCCRLNALEKMGYRIAIYPSETQRAAIHAMSTALSTAQTRRHDGIDRRMR